MLKRCCRNSLLLVLSLLCAGAVPHGGARQKGSREPIVITSETMEADKLGDTITFRGDVKMKKEDMTVNSDTMVVFYDAPSKGINEIDATGNVVVRREGRTAFSKQAFYYSKEEKIVLTGEARIIENENELGGDRITLFMRDDRSIVEGGRVLFYEDKQRQKAGKIK